MRRFVLAAFGLLSATAALTSAPSSRAGAEPRAAGATASRATRREALLVYRDRVAQATVTLPVKGCAGSVVWQADRVLTAAHCIPEDATRLEVTTSGGRSIESSIEYLDRDADLALLQLDEPTYVVPLEVATELPHLSTPVLFVGRIDRATPVQVARIERFGRCPSLPHVEQALFTTIHARPGDSGSPIVDNRLRVVGLIHGGASCHIAAPTAPLGQKIATGALHASAAPAAADPALKTYRAGPFVVESLPNGFRLNWSFDWNFGARR